MPVGSYRRENAPSQAKSKPENLEDLQIVDKREKVETPTSVLSEGIQEDLKDSIDNTKTGAERAKTYEQILEERGLTLEKAHAIVDSMLEKGFYEETLSIQLPTKVPITVTFRTRTQGDYIRYLRALEAYSPKFVEEQREIQLRYFLASSIIAFKGKTFKAKDTDEDKFFDEKLSWIEAQPERIVNLLGAKLNVFDMQVLAALNEGAVENF